MYGIDHTHDPALRSWVSDANGHRDFPVQNLPIGIFMPAGEPPRSGVAIGDHILDVAACREAGFLSGAALEAGAAMGTSLNDYMALDGDIRTALRHRLSELLSDVTFEARVRPLLHRARDCSLAVPAEIGDYTDFYAGIHHARKATRMFRPDADLPPNYKYVPIGYHGRSSTVVPSATPVARPSGQRVKPGGVPALGPSEMLDFELEMGIWTGARNALGEPIPIADAGKYIVGLCLLNDWSARDIQGWEMTPLGPFLSKNFLTTVSPWIVTIEALAPFRIAQPKRPDGDPPPMGYLLDEEDQQRGAFAIEVETLISTKMMRAAGIEAQRIGVGPVSNLYWTAAQLLAHHTVGGCRMRPGDLLGTGTISTPDDGGSGCLLEMTEAGRKPLVLPTGETRTFLEAGDELKLRGRATAPGWTAIGFGDCSGRVL